MVPLNAACACSRLFLIFLAEFNMYENFWIVIIVTKEHWIYYLEVGDSISLVLTAWYYVVTTFCEDY